MSNKPQDKLILLFSPREKKRNILSAGLIHAGYRVIEAATAYSAGVKANQYLPDLAIADISRDNIKDFLFLTRLESAVRTSSIKVLLSITADVKEGLDTIREEIAVSNTDENRTNVHTIIYPFPFSAIIEKIESILNLGEKDDPSVINQDKKGLDLLSDKLYSSELTVNKKLALIGEQVNRQWAFPFTIIRSLQIMGDDSSCTKELSRCIESDLAAASALLNIANKVQFSSRYRRIESIHDAVVRIGFNETRNVLALLTLIEITSGIHMRYGFRRSEFWMHSLAVGVLTEMICKHIKYDKPELGFIAGLVHDIGKIPIDTEFTPVFISLLEETSTRITSFHAVEKESLGFTHAETGHYFTGLWNFPNPVSLAILNHHDPDRILSTSSLSEKRLQEAVFVANIYAKALSFGHSCDEILPEIPKKILEDLKIPSGPPFGFTDTAYSTLRKYQHYLNIASGEVYLAEPQKNTRETTINFIMGSSHSHHPIITALSSAGYPIMMLDAMPAPETSGVFIFLPDKNVPLDIVLDDDDNPLNLFAEMRSLKIFLLDLEALEETGKDALKGDFVLMNRNTIDMRFLIHIIEDFITEKSMSEAGL